MGERVSVPLIYAKKMRLPSAQANVVQALNMALAFERAGCDVYCFPGVSTAAGGRFDGKDVLLDSPKGIEAAEIPPGWRLLPGGNKGMYGLLFRLALSKTIFSRSTALLYTRDISEAEYLRLLTRLVKRPLFYEAHEILHLMHKAEGKPYWQDTLHRERAVFSAVSGLICTTEQVAEQAREELGYKGSLLIAPNGYNPALFHPLPLFTEETPWPGAFEPFVAVYAGNFYPGKGVEVLIESLAHLPERFHLRIVGGNAEKEFPALDERVEALGLRSRIAFTGAVPHWDVRAACAGAHAFVIPQQSEFFFSPLKLYEAMALGLPVVCTPLSIFSRQIAAGSVFSAPSAEPEGLARVLAELAGQPALAQNLREKGLVEAGNRTWEQRARTIMEFIADGASYS